MAERKRGQSGASVIATHFWTDLQTVTHHRYQAGHTGGVAVYSLEHTDKATGKVYRYLCCPAVGAKPPARFSLSGTPWEVIGVEDGRAIYGMPDDPSDD